MKRQPVIRLEGVAVGYRQRRNGTRTVAEGLDAAIRSGELTCLLGPNGVGKSTLLRTLSAFQPPLAGRIEVAGRPLERCSARDLSHTIAVVLTERCAPVDLPVEELVGMGRSPYTDFWGRLRGEDRRIVGEAIARVGIDRLRKRTVDSLSDGERQKVMIAKALAQQTPVILLDEPTAFLDFPSKVETMRLLHRLTRETGRSIFLSTHDVELALQIADRIWLMQPGRGLTTGTPEDLALDGTLAQLFPQQEVRFDSERGIFCIDHPAAGRIGLQGTGTARAMAAKALRRIGLEPVGEATERGLVEAAERQFSLKKGETTLVCSSVEELLDLLMQ